MPSHPNIPGVEAFIVTNEQPCEEHDGRTPLDRHVVERYIVADSGATFEVHVRFSHPFADGLPVSVVISMDGEDLDELLIQQRELYGQEGYVSAGSISNSGQDYRLHKYRFAELAISESVPVEDIEAQKKRLANVGTISVYCYQVESPRLNRAFEMPERDVLDPGTVHEKALKGDALSHAISLEDAECIANIEYFDAEYANDGEPLAIFHFHYRSLKALRDLHVIRHTPEPIDLIDCDDEVIQTSSQEQIRRMFAHWKRQEEIRQRAKRERSESVTVVEDGNSPTTMTSDNAYEDVVVLGAIDLRKKRRKRCKPTEEDEIIELD